MAQPLEALQAKVSHGAGQSCLHDRTPINLWIPRFRCTSLGGNTPCISSDKAAGRIRHHLHVSTGEGQLEAPCFVTLGPVSFNDSNLCPFTVINHNNWYSCSGLLKLRVVLETLQTCSWCRKGGLSYRQCPSP